MTKEQLRKHCARKLHKRIRKARQRQLEWERRRSEKRTFNRDQSLAADLRGVKRKELDSK